MEHMIKTLETTMEQVKNTRQKKQVLFLMQNNFTKEEK